ncbi:MAG: hypothetical protein EXR73_12240 [Myxococcales bacterium]|nr:hypothetical protein [Myxococcales bacterium]
MSDGASYGTIRCERQGALLRLTLNRPERRNPIGPLTCGELVHALTDARDDDTVRVVLLTGAGKVFSAGGDLAQLGGGGAPEGSVPPASLPALFTTMHALGKPIVAMVNGHALAGGLGLVVACDLVLCADTAELGLTEIGVGLWPMMITAELVRNIGRKKTLELMLGGERISAAEGERLGLVNRVVPAARLEEETLALCARLAARSPTALRLGLRAFYDTQDLSHGDALAHLEGQLGAVLATEDAVEGITAFLQKRAPVWKGR